jgi:hypothetical protein
MREYNEDRYQAMVLDLSDNKKKQNDEFVNRPILDVENLQEIEGNEGQLCYFAVFDGYVEL